MAETREQRIQAVKEKARAVHLKAAADNRKPEPIPEDKTADDNLQVMQAVSQLLKLEKQLFSAASLEQVRFIIVNDIHKLVSCEQAVLLENLETGRPAVKQISNITGVDKTSPFVSWVSRLAKSLNTLSNADQVHAIKRLDVPEPLRRDWRELAFSDLLWVPLRALDGRRQAVLLMGRATAWQADETVLLEHLRTAIAWRLFSRQSVSAKKLLEHLPSKLSVLMLVAAMASMFIPVRLSVLAPAEITATSPYMVTAPFNGVVAAISVKPGQQVAAGQLLLQMDEAQLKSHRDTVRQELAVARAQLHQTRQTVFNDASVKSKIAELEASVDLKQVELSYAQQQLQEAMVSSDVNGIAIVDHPEQWKGRPVQVGERILTVADPSRVEISVYVPVKDSIALMDNAEVELFLDTSPLTPLSAKTVNAAYEPAPGPDNSPAYLVRAALSAGHANPLPRIGLRGTAKIYGQQVSLFYYLFRRPVTAVRQWLGW